MKILLLTMLLITPALAQQTPQEQALGQKLLQEINQGLQCNATVIDLNKKLADLQKQLDEMKKEKVGKKD